MPIPGVIASSYAGAASGSFKRSLGTGITTASSLTVVITTTGAIDVGDLVVVRVATDNTSSIGPNYTCTDSGGNTWVQLAHKPSGIGTNGSSACSGIYATKATVAVAAGGTITITQSNASTAKAIYAESFIGFSTTTRSTSVTAGGPSATPSVTSGTVAAGDLVIGAFAVESQTAFPGDADTLNGAWSTQFLLPNATGGTDTSRMEVAGQYKIPNASGAQTYETSLSTGATTDWGALIAVLQPSP